VLDIKIEESSERVLPLVVELLERAQPGTESVAPSIQLDGGTL
jgi:hypothetical protein